MMRIRVRQRGQITLPIKLRSKYKLEVGALLEVQELSEGILLKPIGPLELGEVVGEERHQKILEELEAIRGKWR